MWDARMKTFLIISPEAWDAHTVSKHHYAETLVKKGHRVLFLGPPMSSGKEIRLERVAQETELYVVKSGPVMRGLRFLPSGLARIVQARWLRRLENTLGGQVDVIWLFENSRFYDLGFAGDRLKIYHQVDLNQNFHPDLAARTADAVFCTTDIIRDRLQQHCGSVHKIHHGTVDMDALPDVDLSPFADDRVNAVYIGNLNMAYIDYKALADTIAAHPDKLFHLVGQYDEATPLRKLCRDADNVEWWGRVSYRVIPSILNRADILLVAYRKEHHRDQASPHKFMEYLLSGKVIVTSYTAEYTNKAEMVEMAEPDQHLNEIFAHVAEDLQRYNSAEKQALRRRFAQDHTYDRQLTRIDEIVRRETGRSVL